MTDTAHTPRLLPMPFSLIRLLRSEDPAFEHDLNPLTLTDLRLALRAGWEDFRASRRQTLPFAMIFPVFGLALLALALQLAPASLLLPLLAGFALVGPVASIGLYEVSCRREMGETIDLLSAFRVVARPAMGAVAAVGAVLSVAFAAWLGLAWLLFEVLVGHETVSGFDGMMHAVVQTTPGAVFGAAAIVSGAVLALGVLSMTVVTLPMLIDRSTGLLVAVRASVQLTRRNPLVVLTWGAFVAAVLALAAIPALLGLVVALPVLGHATWHLYRRSVV